MTHSFLSRPFVVRLAALTIGAVVFTWQAAPQARLQTSTQTPAAAPAVKHFGTWGVDLTAMDRSVNPGDDFDRFVNGTWEARTEIPADQPSAGVGYDVFNLTQEQVRAIIENAPPTSQLGGMYQSFMNEAAVEKADDAPLQVDLKQVAAIADKAAFTKYMGHTNGAFGFALVYEVGP